MRDIAITDLTCHARGALEHFPGTRSVIDVGAQSTRAMRVEPNGRVSAFRMNDKCAAGAGRFIERIARSLDVPLENVGTLSLESREPVEISSVCAVLAESEVINHVTAGCTVENILSGAHRSIADRVAGLLKQIGLKEEVTLSGGMSRNAGMLAALEHVLGVKLNVHPEAEFGGAHGAALWGMVRARRTAA
jgi:predicted CoA-substrate-specific enzyme activase